MATFGLIGYPLGHSLSKKYFTGKFHEENLSDCSYELFPLPDLSGLFELIEKRTGLKGLNVTIPHKEKVIGYLNELDELARNTWSVNCIRITRKTDKIHLKGFNTDVYGFEKAIIPHLKLRHKSALILGTGGSSGSVAYVLEKLGIRFKKVSRKPVAENHIGYEMLDKHLISSHKIIINTTPLGMYPDINGCPSIPFNFITVDHLLFDLIYNPAETVFMKRGKASGAEIVNGMEMLHQQAERSWHIWNQ